MKQFTCIVVYFFYIAGALANTESLLFRIPSFFDVTPYSNSFESIPNLQQNSLTTINESHSVILDYRILTNNTVYVPSLRIKYDSVEGGKNSLFVKLNNYGNNSFTNGDLLYAKLCWPAIYPYSFKLSTRYLWQSELLSTSSDSFDLYLEIEYEFDAYPYVRSSVSKEDSLSFQLYVSKLPSRWVPIPWELYDIFTYIVDIFILLSLPLYNKAFRRTFYTLI